MASKIFLNIIWFGICIAGFFSTGIFESYQFLLGLLFIGNVLLVFPFLGDIREHVEFRHPAYIVIMLFMSVSSSIVNARSLQRYQAIETGESANVLLMFFTCSGVSIILLIYLFGSIINKWTKKCPECGKWDASIPCGAKILDKWVEGRDITRTDVTKNRDGDVIHTTDRTERINVEVTKKKYRYQCRYCDAKWAHITTS